MTLLNRQGAKSDLQDVEVRRATVEDIPSAVPLVKEFVDESIGLFGFAIDKEIVLENFKKFVDHAVVAYSGNRMVGVLAGRIDDFDLSDQKIFQEHVWYVSKDFRRNVGPRLMGHMEELLHEQGIDFMVMVHLGNKKDSAIGRYYERLGFMPMETHYIKQLV